MNEKIRSLPVKDYVDVAYELHKIRSKRYEYFVQVYGKYIKYPNRYVFLGLSMDPEIPFVFDRTFRTVNEFIVSNNERKRLFDDRNELKTKHSLYRENRDYNKLQEIYKRKFSQKNLDKLVSIKNNVDDIYILNNDLTYNVADMRCV